METHNQNKTRGRAENFFRVRGVARVGPRACVMLASARGTAIDSRMNAAPTQDDEAVGDPRGGVDDAGAPGYKYTVDARLARPVRC